ncbi:hypothetical protein JOB18_007438 [Solea senegalensis]|nr:hypothetical protein JOB18_007438 [Solea senegalensis]
MLKLTTDDTAVCEEPTFQLPNQFIFDVNALAGLKILCGELELCRSGSCVIPVCFNPATLCLFLMIREAQYSTSQLMDVPGTATLWHITPNMEQRRNQTEDHHGKVFDSPQHPRYFLCTFSD